MSYTLAGRKLLPEQIVAGVFGTLGLVTYLSTRGGKGDPLAVPLNATSKEQEAFIRNRIIEKEREAHDKSMGKAAKDGAKEGAQQATKGH